MATATTGIAINSSAIATGFDAKSFMVEWNQCFVYLRSEKIVTVIVHTDATRNNELWCSCAAQCYWKEDDILLMQNLRVVKSRCVD